MYTHTHSLYFPPAPRAAGQRVCFFMRKGADLLSKWVGEAERQLRLLFEEAARQQPSIIFFDEARALAYRSYKPGLQFAVLGAGKARG
jgi:SpoVK/Ycf46/Vps4 family AAA+-type ATPase